MTYYSWPQWNLPSWLLNASFPSVALSSGGSRISPRRGRQLSGGGAPTYDFAKFSQKLHEIERIWTPGGRPKFYYVDPPLLSPMPHLTTSHTLWGPCIWDVHCTVDGQFVSLHIRCALETICDEKLDLVGEICCKQESIPVGCVSPTLCRTGGGLPNRDYPPAAPRTETSISDRDPCEQNHRQL